jgi:sodium/hydrogen antiporter
LYFSGAVFISTLAADKLPRHDASHPPDNQAELLAATIQPIVAFMVLFSIAIHGLSIPSFSLGKRVHSVSRTWSRHAPPDWTNQARLVERGENIVINRDSAMERGELAAPASKRESMAMEEAGGRSAAATIAATPEKEESTTDEAAKNVEEGGQSPEQEKAKEDNPPDGEERVMEWKEGEDMVIERRRGPGEEVS